MKYDRELWQNTITAMQVTSLLPSTSYLLHPPSSILHLPCPILYPLSSLLLLRLPLAPANFPSIVILQRVEEIKNKRQAHHIFQRMKLAKKIQKAKDIKEVTN